MRAIFISYRRDDAEGQAGRLFDDLTQHFGEDAVFMDVAAIEPGRDFRRVIDEQVASCGVLLAVIGKAWLTARDESGARRLDDPTDFVRLETASALRRDIPVIPVLVHGATMPREEDLPEDLKELAFRNGVELTHARWDSDVQLLVKALRPYVQAKETPTPPRRESAAPVQGGPMRAVRLGVAGVVAALGLTAGAYLWHQRSVDVAVSPTPGEAARVIDAPASAPVATPAPAPVSPAPPQGTGTSRFATIWEKAPGPAWEARHGLTSQAFQQELDKLAAQGYRLVDVSGYGVGGQERYAAIWQKRAGPAWEERHGLTADAYQREFDRLTGQGYRPVHVSGYAVGGEVRFAAIFEKGSGIAWIARHDLTSDQYQRQFNRFTADGYRLVDVSGYAVDGQERYAAIWEKSVGPDWETHHGMTEALYQQEFDRLAGQGYRPVRISAWGVGNTSHYAAIWEKGQGPQWASQHSLLPAQYQEAFNSMTKAGFQLSRITAYQAEVQ